MTEREVLQQFTAARLEREQRRVTLGKRIRKFQKAGLVTLEIGERLGLSKSQVLAYISPTGTFHHYLVD